jgi:phosphatidylserine/phosphatidylglycerophosphate/cardiolipin synthase-like enzyme
MLRTHLAYEQSVAIDSPLDSWPRQADTPPTPKHCYPALSPQGDEIVRAIGSRSDEETSPIYMTLVSAISRADAEVHLTVAYFGPDPVLLKALTGAASCITTRSTRWCQAGSLPDR